MGVPNSLVVFAALLVCASAQRPFYASSAQYPPVLPQNLPNNTDSLGNRFGENSTPAESTAKNPVYNVEQELIDRVKEYPRDKQPFWYLNAAQLNSFKNPQYPQQSQQVQPAPDAQSQQEQSQQLQRQLQQLRSQQLQQQLQSQQFQQQQQRRLQQQRQLRIDDDMLRLEQELMRRPQQWRI